MVGCPHQAVLSSIQQWLDDGQRVWLSTIVQTWGSSPRPAGSWLAVNESGHWSGSVSGGCLEEDLLARCVEQRPEAPALLDYGVTDNDRAAFQLPCGGRIRLYVEPLFPGRHQAHIRELLAAMEARKPVYRRIELATGDVSLGGSDTRETGETLGRGDRSRIVEDEGHLLHALTPACKLLLVGAGEVARYVSSFALAAGFDVTLCEPREAFSRGWQGEVPLVRALPDDLVNERFSDTWSGVLALAHDPRVDDMALLAALNSDAFYVGAMGSVQTSRARRERLASLGLGESQLARLHAPIGVKIPSKTPAEIAIAIVADLIQARWDMLASKPAL
ncbi:XdhC family protein [Marinobacter zhejiangensis]|uniref:Xanthine dehydrogenase accessory factor n=1 Tax=Marinobacter zhejiangensis TaxID=488535 RepID=A0A1I4R9C0_9GAMM|nr:XdhC family protein [Marinobacter zhejiangensis]SFM48908.1 xanthine dehydrogenase accessory factor [Marinobacter zhejiangensis]